MNPHEPASNEAARPPAAGDTLVEVAVNAGQPARTPFTYSAPEGMVLRPGHAVFVPFGPRVLQGIVMRTAVGTELESVRPVVSIADPEPILDDAHIALAEWMAGEYLAPLWDCIACCLPSGYGQKPVTMVSPVDIPPLLPVYPKDQKILQFIAEHGRVPIDTLREGVGQVTLTTLQRLQADGHLTVAQGLARPSGRPRFERRGTRRRPRRGRCSSRRACREVSALGGGAHPPVPGPAPGFDPD
ncbi:MAG TPA: hypothetical protein PJ994_01355 [Tepidiformaceae bacterium]|nr:hypothetical protein [Tepidiformaceae bacterium]